MSDIHHLGSLLNPQSIAVIGASDNPLRIGGRPISYMLEQGYKGKLMPVNPNRQTIQGLPAYKSIADLPEPAELAIVAVAANLVPGVIEELGKCGTKIAIVFSAGFAEMGNEGIDLQMQMLVTAKKYGLRVLGPNSLGVVNPGSRFYGSFTSVVENDFPKAGRVGIASQSGAYGSHILGLARANGIGVSACIMSGNECDISLGDIIHALVADPDTDVIAVYSEGIRDGERLLSALENARHARKPVVMMKVGTSEVGSAAAQSHTASIAGNDAVTDAILAEYGVVRARSTEHMLDVARLATRRIYPVNNSLGVITVSGGAGVIVSDAAEVVGLPMPAMPEKAQHELKALIPYCAPVNPVDCTAQFMNDLTMAGRFTETVVRDGGYQSILGFFTYTVNADSIAEGLRDQLNEVRRRYPDRLFVLSILASRERVQQYEMDGFTVFEDPARAVIAIEAMGKFGEAFARVERQRPSSVTPFQLPAQTPNEAQAKNILAEAGISVAKELTCTCADEAVAAADAIGYPVVLKILSADIPHKTEIGGVLLNITDAVAAREGYGLLIERAANAAPQAKIDGVLVARQLTGGVECIMGIQRDPVFGPVAMVGLGGIYVEILKDVALRRCPFGVDVAESMIRSLRGAALLTGVRGKPPVDISALADMLSKLSVAADQAGPGLQSIDLNPVVALPCGQGAYALDAVIELASPESTQTNDLGGATRARIVDLTADWSA